MKIILLTGLLLLKMNGTKAQDTAYGHLWNDPVLNKQIRDNIERYRKGDASVLVLDANGTALPGAVVDIHQETSDFLFGSNLFALGQLKTPALNRKYESAFTHLFNFATIPFYWRDLEPVKGHPRYTAQSAYIWRRPPPDVLVKWCQDNHITVKGHALMYAKNMFMPDWTRRDDPAVFLQQAEKHLSGLAERYGKSVAMWDVANEEMPRKRHPEEWHKVPADYLSWCFRKADSLFPEPVRLLYNDGTYQVHKDTREYIDIFKHLKQQGNRVDGMGIQFHAFNRKGMLEGKDLTPETLIRTYQALSSLDLPLYITEITIPGNGSRGPFLQAEIVKNLYRLWFSTPRMAGITWWNLADGLAFGQENDALGGLLDSMMNPKPAYRALDTLINQVWRTHVKRNTGSNGRAYFRGFYGQYVISVMVNGLTYRKNIHFSDSGPHTYTIQL